MTWLDDLVSDFGVDCKTRLAGPGDREAAIRTPIDGLIRAAGSHFSLIAVPHDEVRDTERAVRPDYAISVNGAITGYIEVKKPGLSVDPTTFTGHNKTQWERQKDLPNLLYTNGIEWRLWRDGTPVGDPVYLRNGPLTTAGGALSADPDFETLLRTFLDWSPAPITSVGRLVQAVAPLTRLLRGEVADQLTLERGRVRARPQSIHDQPFIGLANDWRAMLFPDADDAVFSDGYAQAVTFALLLARTEGIDLGTPLHQIGAELGAAHHTLMGRALQLLTDAAADDFKVTLDLLVRVVGAVRWDRIRRGSKDAYLHLYERFLAVYDPDWRKLSGSYYTPHEVVESMVGLVDEALRTQLGKTGFGDPTVLTVDPAMGTGTYLHTIVEAVATAAHVTNGPGSVPGAITDLAKRLAGFELQIGPYAVAELRAADLLRSYEAQTPTGGMRMYVTDTLDNPYTEVAHLSQSMEPVAQSRRRANKIKAETPVTVVIGNPPYRERADGMGGWVEKGDANTRAPLEAFHADGNGLAEYVLKNLYIYFWRWGTWKVFDAHHSDTDDAGIVCYISTGGYLRGPGFKGMREYLRRTCDEGWIIDLTPEGQTPPVPTRIFPGVRQPLAIGLFVRTPGADRDQPANIHYRSIHGLQATKFERLAQVSLSDDGWRGARSNWTAPFTPAPPTPWDDYPALNDLLPWSAPGVKPNRTWVYAPSTAILRERWESLLAETDPASKALLLRASDTSTLDTVKEPLPGTDTYKTTAPLAAEHGQLPEPVAVGYRSFDRQLIIPDARLIDRARTPLWNARSTDQLFFIEQHAEPIASGPGVVVTALIPDQHHFNNRGGRTLPSLHPAGRPNAAPGLLAALSTLVAADAFEGEVTAEDLAAYIVAVVSHPLYTLTFLDELTTPGVRVPLTADPGLFQHAVQLGRYLIWAQTYGARCVDSDAGRPSEMIRFPFNDPRRVLNQTAVSSMPDAASYDNQTETLRLGTGTWSPVRQEVFDYDVGGKNVIRSWVNYRKQEPGGKKTSPLDHVHVTSWPPEWSTELTDLLTLLTRLVEAEPEQAELLQQVLGGPLLNRSTLAAHHVQWPTAAADRRPNYTPPAAAVTSSEVDDQLPLS